jgi:hypothetical protein
MIPEHSDVAGRISSATWPRRLFSYCCAASRSVEASGAAHRNTLTGKKYHRQRRQAWLLQETRGQEVVGSGGWSFAHTGRKRDCG